MTTVSSFALRIPASLMEDVKALATQDAVSVNQFLVQATAEKVATLATSALTEAKQEFEGVLAGARTAREQRVRVSSAAMLGVLGGVLLWFMAAALLPWGVGHRLAAALVNTGGRWKAAEVLMEEASPTTWDRVVRLSKACPPDTLIELCEAAMVVRTIPPGPTIQPAPEGAKTLAPPTVAPGPPLSRGKVGVGR